MNRAILGHRHPVCIAIGLHPAVHALPGIGAAEIRHLDIADVDGSKDVAAAALIVAPLFGPGFDAIELMELLSRGGFAGVLRLLSPRLPDREVVLRELRPTAEGSRIRLELVEIG